MSRHGALGQATLDEKAKERRAEDDAMAAKLEEDIKTMNAKLEEDIQKWTKPLAKYLSTEATAAGDEDAFQVSLSRLCVARVTFTCKQAAEFDVIEDQPNDHADGAQRAPAPAGLSDDPPNNEAAPAEQPSPTPPAKGKRRASQGGGPRPAGANANPKSPNVSRAPRSSPAPPQGDHKIKQDELRAFSKVSCAPQRMCNFHSPFCVMPRSRSQRRTSTALPPAHCPCGSTRQGSR